MSSSDKIVRLQAVLDRTGLSRSTLYRKIAEGTFPAQVKISARRAGWYETDINRWFADPMGDHSGDRAAMPASEDDEDVAGEAILPGGAMILLPVVLPVALQAVAHGSRNPAQNPA